MNVKAIKARIPIIILYILSFSIIGIWDYVSGGFDASKFATSEYWTNLGATYTAAFFVISATLMERVLYFKTHDELYNIYTSKITDFAKNVFKPITFNKFAKVANKQRKINAWIKQCQNKLFKLNRKLERVSRKWFLKKIRFINMRVRNIEHKMEKYELMQKPEWIENNFYKVKSKYNSINSSVVLSGVSSNVDDDSDNDYIVRHKTMVVVKDLIPGMLFFLALGMLLLSISIDSINSGTIDTILTTIFKFLALGYNVYKIHKYSAEYFEKTHTHDVRWRCSVIDTHNQWVLNESKGAE